MKKSNLVKRLFAMLLVAALVCSMVPATVFAENVTGDTTITWEKLDSDEVTVKLPLRDEYEGKKDVPVDHKDSDIVRVSIVLEDDSTLAAGYPSEDIADNKKAMVYRDRLETKQKKMEKTISTSVLNGKDLDVVWNLTLAANIISANVEYGKIEEIKALRGVKDVVLENQYEPAATEIADEPNMSTANIMIGSNLAWASGYTGAGSRIAIIDTGADLDHQSLDPNALEFAYAENAKKAGKSVEEYKASLNLLTADEIASVWDKLNASGFISADPSKAYFNEKIAYGVNYIDKNLVVDHDHDSQGEHGSHVSGIATANRFVKVGEEYKPALDTVMVQGNAPDAQLLTMKVFGAKGGAYDTDYMSAIEDAIVLGADSVNLSLGSAAAGYSYSDEYEEVMDNIVKSGTTVVMSGGNNSYWAAETTLGYNYYDDANYMTGGSPGSFTNSFTVASVENDGSTGNFFTANGEDYLYFYSDTSSDPTYAMKPFTVLSGDYEFVMVAPTTAGNEAAVFAALKNEVAGKIAICWRGGSSFFEKANATTANGAVATIVGNNAAGALNMNMKGYTGRVPCVGITQADALNIMAGAEAHVTADGLQYWTGTINVTDEIASVAYGSDYYTMSDFSSFGTPGNLELTPEITAPGGNIYSINGAIAGGKAYELMSGTSMAAPQVAGLVAVMGQYIRENDLVAKTGLSKRQLVQSLLMSTSEPMIDVNSGSYYPVFQQGSGLARVDKATNSGSYILMDENATESYADGKVKVELKDDADRKGEYEFSFSVNNMTEEDKSFELGAEFFTQDVYVTWLDAEMTAMAALRDTWTVPLSAIVEWTVDGGEVAPEAAEGLDHCDFDGDGDIDTDDGQALLDYIVENRDMIYNEEYADFDLDGDIDSYDAYLFFLHFVTGTVTVPANGSINVTCKFSLLNIDEYDYNGNYVEGYAFIKELVSADGAEGDSHSIPVFGYYGDWSEPSMFDKGSYLEWTYGEPDEMVYLPYLYNENGFDGNVITIKYLGETKEYIFGGNPMLDEKWMPERDALNAENSINKIYFTLIRNAQVTRVFAVGEDGTEYLSVDSDPAEAAYYYPADAVWRGTNYNIAPGFNASDIPEGTRVTLGISAATELDVAEDGSVAWDELAPGATFSQSFTIDNTAPVISELKLVSEQALFDSSDSKRILTFAVTDNEYISAVAVFDSEGNLITLFESDPEAEKGETMECEVELPAGVDKYLIEAYDYAANLGAVKISLVPIEGDVTVNVTPETLDMIANTTAKVSAEVGPWGANDKVTWTSSDESVATVSENGLVTAIAEGTCEIIATADADPTVSDSCVVNVSTIPYTLVGELQGTDSMPVMFEWNLETDKTWTKTADLTDYISAGTSAAFYDGFWNQAESNTDYAISLNGLNDGSYYGSMENIFFSNIEVAPWDMTIDPATSISKLDDAFAGVYASYVFDEPNAVEGYVSNMNSYIGAAYLMGIDWLGSESTPYGDASYYLALDDEGSIWEMGFVPGLGNFTPYEYTTDLDFSNWQYGDSTYTSFIVADDGTPFAALFDGNTSVIYMFLMNEDGKSFTAVEIGTVGDGVWPTVLLSVVPNAAADSTNGVSNKVESFNVSTDEICRDNLVSISELSTTVIGGTNEAEELPEGPELGEPVVAPTDSIVEVADDEKTVTVTLVADEENTNGVVTVKYDADKLEYVSTDVKTQYSSVNDSEAGTVRLDWVQLDGVKTGDKFAVLTFNVKTADDTTVEVIWNELNGEDDAEPATEELAVEYPHEETEIVGAVEPTCDEDGYTGDVVCKDCGKVLEKGEVIPALGHDFDDDGVCKRCGYVKVPDTGDHSHTAFWSVSFLTAALALVLIMRKRRVNG